MFSEALLKSNSVISNRVRSTQNGVLMEDKDLLSHSISFLSLESASAFWNLLKNCFLAQC